ncbi:sensor histidine kinase [Clostridium saccharoperbutylacetonicum]|uniref:sensor histidine kinase n=1 Tax=Clostridium saccharoperbutylacetonicum TaxID=36745 RepID=UPI0009838F83|nr:HAMP domain-containing sensor histidine kinase [Clostridium saccharoperbutylacetonicum]AQR96810.1 alkaline phosphatase synthesis sensor protein PhoR [Clostridium saccharoperbutylacetonicum]NSB32688.1 signal transduction histidine kinase [Clostridium saccharoperbutylacetonicum]
MKTIKTKLFCIFLGLMISLIAGGIILNSLFLESYYVYKNKGILVSVSEKIKDEYISSAGSEFEYADMVQNIENINTIITDKNFNIKYNSVRKKTSEEEKRLSKQVQKEILANDKKNAKKYVYYIAEKENAQNTRLVFFSRINDDEFIILTKSVRSIHQSVVIANEFFIIAGIIIIFIGAVIVLIFSNKITKPIIEMSNVAESISNLQFDKVIKTNSEDEIGRLGNSINKISDKLNCSINELKRDINSKQELIRNMSHELKTPIGIIKGYAEGLKYGVVEDKEKMAKYCTILVEECDRMDKLVKELLNYSMMEGGMIKLNITAFNIKALLSRIIERFTPVFAEKNISLNLECIDDFIISADMDMLEKALNNYITNAIDHVSDKKVIDINVENGKEVVAISVANTGEHIPLEEINKIWDVCYRIDKARSRKYGGHGIGLSIVKLIAELHEGAASVENIDGGVKFSIEIPS